MATRPADPKPAPAPVSNEVAQEPVVPKPLPYEPLLPHPSVAERLAWGKSNRQQTPRRSQALWQPWPTRPDPVALLEEQAETRWAELVPIRHGRMSTSPFAFFRGAALIMASDLAATPRTAIRTQTCGDAHLANFGIYSAPDRSLVFDINDFDETAPGPWEWDLKRLSASFEIALRDRGLSAETRRGVVLAAVQSYRTNMSEFAQMTNLDVWHARLDANMLLERLEHRGARKDAKLIASGLESAMHKNSLRALGKLTRLVDGRPAIISQPPLIVPDSELYKGNDLERFNDIIHALLRNYANSLPDDRRRLLENYEFRQIARKVVGVGSVGLRSWIVLAVGRDDADPLFLQLKQSESSVFERFVGRSRYRNHGRRVVEGQRLMQAASDILLGWFRTESFDGVMRDYYVRQLWDGKWSLDVSTAPETLLEPYGRACGWALARAHARTGDRIAIASYLGRSTAFDEAIADFACAYAEQNERDYELMLAAIKSGRIQAEMGV